MQNFLREAKIEVKGLDMLDLGASTGGFTDCLLQEGAVSATCVGVGHGQLHYKLRTDSRVTNLEKTNLRHLTAKSLPQSLFELVVMDLSFISLRKVLPQAWSFVHEGGRLVALVKPQFECARKEADQGRGVISDPLIQQRTLQEIKDFARLELPGSDLFAETESSPRGADGNLEFFLGWVREDRLKANLIVFGRFFRNEISQKEIPALFGPGKLKIFDPFLDFRYLKISLLEEVNGLKATNTAVSSVLSSSDHLPSGSNPWQDSTSFCPKALCLFNSP